MPGPQMEIEAPLYGEVQWHRGSRSSFFKLKRLFIARRQLDEPVTFDQRAQPLVRKIEKVDISVCFHQAIATAFHEGDIAKVESRRVNQSWPNRDIQNPDRSILVFTLNP